MSEYGLDAYLDQQENLVTLNYIALIQNALTELTGENTLDDGFIFASVVRSKYGPVWTGIDANVTDKGIEFSVQARYDHCYDPDIPGDDEFYLVTSCGLDVLEGDHEGIMLGLSEKIKFTWEEIELTEPAVIAERLNESAGVLLDQTCHIVDEINPDSEDDSDSDKE